MKREDNDLTIELDESMRALLTEKYNDPKECPNYSIESAELELKNAEEDVIKAKRQKARAIMSMAYVQLLKQYGWDVWDVSDYVPAGQGQFVGTYREYLKRARDLKIPKDKRFGEKSE